MSRQLDPADLPENVARYALAEVAAGRFASVEDVLSAGIDALEARQQADRDWLAYAQKEATEGFAELDRNAGVTRGTPDEIMAHIRADVAASIANQVSK